MLTFTRLIWSLLRERRRQFGLGLLCLFVSRGAALLFPIATRFIVDGVIVERNARALVPILGVLVAAVITQYVAFVVATNLIAKGGQQILVQLRTRIQQHLMLLPVSYFDHKKTGEILSSVTADLDGVRNLIGSGAADFIGAAITAFLAFALMIRLSLLLALFALFPLVVFGVLLFYQLKRLWKGYEQRSEAASTLSAEVAQNIIGIRTIKGYSVEETVAQRTTTRIMGLFEATCNAMGNETALQALNYITGGLIELLVIYVGTREVLEGALTLGEFLTCTLLLAYIVIPVGIAVIAAAQLADAAVAVNRALEVLQTQSENETPSRVIEMPSVLGRIAFEAVSFSYDGRSRALTSVSFQIEPGTMTALVGPSGSGKTTVTSLLCGFYSPDSGKIIVDETDISRVRLDSLRRQLGMVFQETILFPGTILDNLRLASPGATDEQISKACRAACVEPFVAKFPDGYNTQVGERGINLSAGQRQRIALARTLLKNPPVLILDEATSNVDPESEFLIREALSMLTQGRTTIVITHRLTSIRQASQIILFEDGVVLARGTHRELYERIDGYRRQCDSEFLF